MMRREYAHSELDPMEIRVRALQSVLTGKGYIDPAALDEIVDTYQTRIGPRNGARVVAKAWVDPAFRDWLLDDATAAIASLGYTGRQGEHMVAVPNTTTRCTTWWSAPCAAATPGRCSACRPPGTRARLPLARRARPARRAGGFRRHLPEGQAVRVWDSTAEVRYLVIPQRPAGHRGAGEEQLAALVTRDSMIGTGLPRARGAIA
jgi:nitrile hydratase